MKTWKNNNYVSTGKVQVPVLLWMHWIYLERIEGVYTRRLGGWT